MVRLLTVLLTFDTDFNHYSLEKPLLLNFVPSLTQPQRSTFFVTCNVISGSEPFTFRWYKNDRELNSLDTPRYSIDSKATLSFLSVHNIEAHDAGNYSCVVSNDHGFDSQSTMLTVKGLNCIQNVALKVCSGNGKSHFLGLNA